MVVQVYLTWPAVKLVEDDEVVNFTAKFEKLGKCVLARALHGC